MPFQPGLQLEVAKVKYPFLFHLISEHKPKVGVGGERESKKGASARLMF